MIEPQLLVAAYAQGVFPMADEGGQIRWYSPDPRAIFPLDDFHIPHSLARTIRKETFEVRVNTAFEAVIRACGDREETWISEEIVLSYVRLFELGVAHSVEAWDGDQLAGGLYGVALGGAFMGESMFTRVTDASKVCLVFLVERLRERGYELLDSQIPTDHLARFGQTVIPRSQYLQRLARALQHRRNFV